jgi:hypothetical protein
MEQVECKATVIIKKANGMKFLSIFTKTPTHQRFKYTPRFYDPLKEEMEEREKRIKLEIQREQGITSPENETAYRSRISGSFKAARKRSQPSDAFKATLLRFGILLFLTIFVIAFLEFGRPALYLLILIVPFYLYLKFRSK